MKTISLGRTPAPSMVGLGMTIVDGTNGGHGIGMAGMAGMSKMVALGRLRRQR